MKGKVIQTTGSWYQVSLENKQTVNARLKGKFKLENFDTTNPIAVGDEVELILLDNNEYVIEKIFPRKNYIIRQSPRHKTQRHIVASNIDEVLIIASISQPRTSLGFIDRVIAAAECYHIAVTIIINKKDLWKAKENEIAATWINTYSNIGYSIFAINAFNQEDIARVRQILTDKTCLLTGHSGVGKSTLVNQINPNLNLKTGQISNKWNKGKHTTTFATSFEIFDNAFIIDTPGIKEFALLHLEPEEVSDYFVEMRQLKNQCEYSNCMHINEPNCAVLTALAKDKIAISRYESYLNIIDNIEAINYWERK
ncbi:MAG: ribosome small subunit-dependent GTPase A [Chitinophagales bacterium]|nr:ribosome small subunit-dependent GTPase A [Chitinophagales bacterium]